MAYKVRVVSQQTIAELGSRFLPGEEFVWTGSEDRLRFLCTKPEDGGPGYLEVISEVGDEDIPLGTLGELEGQWSLTMKPAMYLDRFPQGPHAALARQIVAAQEADPDEGEEADPDEGENTDDEG